ncbi:MAG: thiamine-phosphate kinase [Thermodesulfobacteriota bacterium]|nr:thiamine-phosphate kinase [Thermodesulfobacteriota bacterium]
MNSNDKKNSFAQVGEFGLIDRIRQQVQHDSSVPLGIGDDCAATVIPEGHLLLTSKDLLIEDIHFRRDWIDMYSLGRKSAAVNLSDIAAMGGTARHLFLGVGLPATLTGDEIDQFTTGFLDETSAAGATLCGGDTCRSGGSLLISVTVQGSIEPQQLITRDSAQQGDAIYVSGTLGDSALALAQLQAGSTPTSYLIQRHHQPTPRLKLGQALAKQGLVTAMIDLSDGLFSDLGHILEQSNLGAIIDQHQIPLSDEVKKHLRNSSNDNKLIIHGGEDYELLFTVEQQHCAAIERLSRQLNLPLSRIGTMLPATSGLNLIDLNGKQQPIQATGFNHFN